MLSATRGMDKQTLRSSAPLRRARYAHSMRVFVFNSGLFYIRPTPAALELLDRLVARVESENGWDQAIFNEARAGPPIPSLRERVYCCIWTALPQDQSMFICSA